VECDLIVIQHSYFRKQKHNYLNLEIDDEDAGRAWFTWTFYRLELF
jgi:hypothetical protein